MSNRWSPHALACSSAFSFWTWVLAFLPSVTTAVLHDRNLFGGSVIAWLAAALTGALAAGVILGVAHLVARTPTHVVTVMAVFLIAGVARGLGVGGAAWALGLVADPQWVLRAASGAVLAVFWLSIATLIVDGFRTHRTTRMQLADRESETQRQLIRTSSELADLRSRAEHDITGEVAHVITDLRSMQDDDETARQALAESAVRLHDLSAGVVRPLSHTAAIAVAEGLPPSDGAGKTHRVFALRAILFDTVTIDPFRPGWLAVLLFPSILMTAIRAYGVLLGILGAAWIIAMAAAVLWCARRIITPRLPHWNAFARAVSVVAIWTGAALASALPVAWSDASGVGPERAWAVFGVPLLAYVPITCLGIAVVTAISQSWALDEDTRAARIAALDWQQARQQQQLWSERQRLGRHLHGTVQSVLTATALSIDAGLRRGTPLAEIRDDACARLAPLLSANDAVGSQISAVQDPSDVLASIARVWSRLARVSVTMTDRATSSLEVDGAAADKVVEITREGIANAIRHGHARNVDVHVDAPPSVGSYISSLDIIVQDDGSMPPSSNTGLGSATLDELCLEWTRESEHGGTVLRCRIPLGIGAAQPT